MHATVALTAATLALAACGGARNASGGPMPPMPATLAVGQSLPLPDRSTLRYVGVSNDSRCPPEARCIRAGDATVTFEHRAGAAPAATVRVIVPDAPAATVGSWRLTVDALAHGPAPTVTVTVAPAGPAVPGAS